MPVKQPIQVEGGEQFNKELFEAFLGAKDGKATPKQLNALRKYRWVIFSREREVAEEMSFDELAKAQAWDLVVHGPWYPSSAMAFAIVTPRIRRVPRKKDLKGAFEASFAGVPLTDEQQAAIDLLQHPTARQLRTRDSLALMAGTDPMQRDRAWISDALAQCPLPLARPKGMEAHQLVRKVQIGNGFLLVIYTATGIQCIPFGKDAYLLDVLISEARKRGERVVSFQTAIEIMRLAGFDVGGHDYKLFKEALERISGLHITLERRDMVKANYRVVKIQSLDIPSQDDVRLEISGQKRLMEYAFEFSEEFYADFMKYYTVIPRDLLDAFAGAPTEYAIARWLYRRTTKANSAAYIPLAEIRKEIAPSDSNLRRFRGKFEKVVETLMIHWPELREGLKPDRVKRKGSDVLVGFHLTGRVPSLIGDRRVLDNGKVGTDPE